MKRRCVLRTFLLAALLTAGVAGQVPVSRTAAAEQPGLSLSGVLDLPTGEPRLFPVKDPFLSPIVPRTAEQDEGPELPTLILTAVLQGSGRAAAVVNGTILRAGDVFLDMKVLEISKNRVIFKRGEGKVTLFMQENLYNPLALGGK